MIGIIHSCRCSFPLRYVHFCSGVHFAVAGECEANFSRTVVVAGMADDGDDNEVGEIEEGKTALDKQQGKQLNAITDLVEERELNSSKVQEALKRLVTEAGERAEAQNARDRELAAVKINPADVDMIAAETEWDKKVAERKLREHGGDAAACLRAVINVA